MRLSLKQSIGLTVLLLAVAGVSLLFISAGLFRDLAYTNEKDALVELLDLKIADRLEALRKRSQELGATLQEDPRLRSGLRVRDITSLSALLDSQHFQYFTTAGVIKLQKLYLFDSAFTLVAHSLHGFNDDQGRRVLCSDLIKVARERSGPDRLRIMSGLCEYQGYSFLGVITPIGGLKPTGYLMIVTDPTYNLHDMEAALASPVRITYANGETEYQSPNWPNAQQFGNYLHAETSVLNGQGQSVLRVSVARDIATFRASLRNTLYLTLVIAFLIITPAFVAVIILLRRAFRPLEKMREASVQLSQGKLQTIDDVSFPEIDVIVGSFNTMASDITRLIVSLENEIEQRQKVEEALKVNQEILESARDQALSASLIKSEFLARMSHEIRTPLTAVIGFSEASLDPGQTENDRMSALRIIAQSGNHLLQIINDILDLSKIEADRLKIERTEISLFELLSQIESFASLQAQEKGLSFEVRFEYPLPSQIQCDPLRLKQIILNLCSNAIKFTETGFVRVTARYSETDQTISLEIRDSGVGVAQAHIDNIFLAFNQAESSTTRKYGGTGLGLSISKHLARLLGGDITAQSEIGQGSCFTVTVLAGEIANHTLTFVNDTTTQARPILNAIATPATLAGSVLLVEDNETNQELVCYYLRKLGLGVEIDIAANGQEAVAAASSKNYDLILMDMQMPIMGGLEATTVLRSLGYKKPIVALTANAMKHDRTQCSAAGCDDFLSKPIDRARLRIVCTRFLYNHSEMPPVVVRLT